MILAEINSEVIGYSRGWWFAEETGPHLYAFVGVLIPAWCRQGIGTVMLRWMENRLRLVANGHPSAQAKFFHAFITESEVGLEAMLGQEGYHPVRYNWQIVRPTMEKLPDFPLPAGLEVRPVLPDH